MDNQIPNNNESSVNSSMASSLNSNTTTPTPIREVIVENTTLSNQDNNLNPPNDVVEVPTSIESGNSSKPPKKNNVSTILLILLFIILFAFIMGMPYIREFVQNIKVDTGLSEIEKEAKEEEKRQQKEEESKKPTPTPVEEQTQELVCTSESTTVGNHSLVETQKFYYNSKKQVLNSQTISNYTFTSIDEDYNLLTKQCDEDSLKYLTHEGYTMSCHYSEGNIEISHEFELKKFTPILEANIEANAAYQQDLDTIITNLTNQGYTCK